MVAEPRLKLKSVIKTLQVFFECLHASKHFTMHWGYNDEQNKFHHCPWGPHNLQVKTESPDSRSLTDVGETDVSKLT